MTATQGCGREGRLQGGRGSAMPAGAALAAPPPYGFLAALRWHVAGASPEPLPATPRRLLTTLPGMSIRVDCHDGVTSLRDADLGLSVLLHGYIKGAVPLALIGARYRALGDACVREWSGSFALLIVDEREGLLWLATDKLGSRQVYLRLADHGYDIASRQEYLVDGCGALDPAGLAWYFSCGVVHGERSLLRGVRRLARATCCRIDAAGRCRRNRYWELRFSDGCGGHGRSAIQEELAALLTASARDCLPPRDPALISLSRGYDVAAIAGLLRGKLNRADLNSFSYGLDERLEGSDALLAGQMAATLGIAHRFVPSYDGQVAAAIERNARWGDGLTHFCDEALAWSILREQWQGVAPWVVTGEHCFGSRPYRRVEIDEAPRRCGLRRLAEAQWLRHLVPGALFDKAVAGQDADLEAIMTQAVDCAGAEDIKDYLFIDQKTCHVLLPWRESYAGRIGRVVCPWLDDALLEFFARLPPACRAEKSLYRETVAQMMPALFAGPRAACVGYIPDWNAELARARKELAAACFNGRAANPLDSFVDPVAVKRLLLRCADAARPARWSRDNLAAAAHGLARGALRRVGMELPPRAWPTPAQRTRFLLCYLVLRRYLEIARRPASP